MKNLNKVLAVIPAKKRSTRLPNKNLKNFFNFPLIHYSINFAIKSGIKNILVSTDSVEVISYSNSMGVETLKRPAELSTDFTPTISVLKHALERFIDKGKDISTVVTLQPSNPLRTSDLFKICYDKFIQNKTDSLITVGENKKKIGFIDENNFYKPLNYKIGSRGQDLNNTFYENGLIYISKSNHIINNDLLGKNIGTYIVDDCSSMVDIDNHEDFKFSKEVFKNNLDKFKYLFT